MHYQITRDYTTQIMMLNYLYGMQKSGENTKVCASDVLKASEIRRIYHKHINKQKIVYARNKMKQRMLRFEETQVPDTYREISNAIAKLCSVRWFVSLYVTGDP